MTRRVICQNQRVIPDQKTKPFDPIKTLNINIIVLIPKNTAIKRANHSDADVTSSYPMTTAWKLAQDLTAETKQAKVSCMGNHRKLRRLYEGLETTHDFESWYQVAVQIDELTDGKRWRANDDSTHYDQHLIHDNQILFRGLRESESIKGLLELPMSRCID